MSALEDRVFQESVEKLIHGFIPPWKVEEEIAASGKLDSPKQFRLAALARQRFLELVTGEKFHSIRVPEKPYKIHYICDKENLGYEIDAQDRHKDCLFCQEELHSLEKHSPLVANYIGGSEAYYSYAGRIKVVGDVEKEFTNLLVYGTGLGPIGVTRGSFLINKFGGAKVSVSDSGRSVRALGFLFQKENLRKRAIRVIEEFWALLRKEIEEKVMEFSGRVVSVEFCPAEWMDCFILYVEFVIDFGNFRGHGDTSRAIGIAKNKIEALLKKNNISYQTSLIAQGYDGDLKPSPRNKRGRYTRAEVRISVNEFEKVFGINVEKFTTAVEIDRIGARKLGCQFYSGMGGEIIPAVYKATKVNPQSSLVSSFQNISVYVDKGDLVYGVELPNIEVGVASNREGLIPPTGREALRIMNIHSARDFAASLAAQVLAGEFNLALEISREKLYTAEKIKE
ncbi:hypothetical protein ACFLRX_04720 [Acidobacteriota bacterium]